MSSELISTEGNQNKIVRILFFIIVIAIVGLAAWLFINFFNNNTKAVPDGYKFSVENHASSDSEKWVTYYVYDKYIIEQKDAPSAQTSPVSPSIIYEGLDTSSLALDEAAISKVCDQVACYKYPKVVDDIKKLLTGRPSREYVSPSL